MFDPPRTCYVLLHWTVSRRIRRCHQISHQHPDSLRHIRHRFQTEIRHSTLLPFWKCNRRTKMCEPAAPDSPTLQGHATHTQRYTTCSRQQKGAIGAFVFLSAVPVAISFLFFFKHTKNVRSLLVPASVNRWSHCRQLNQVLFTS